MAAGFSQGVDYRPEAVGGYAGLADDRDAAGVAHEIKQIEKELAIFDEQLGVLDGRLEPILTPINRGGSGDATPGPKEVASPAAPLVVSLYEIRRRIEHLSHRVASIHSRCAL